MRCGEEGLEEVSPRGYMPGGLALTLWCGRTGSQGHFVPPGAEAPCGQLARSQPPSATLAGARAADPTPYWHPLLAGICPVWQMPVFVVREQEGALANCGFRRRQGRDSEQRMAAST